MKYRVTLKDGIELLITADKEIDAVRQAKVIKDKISVSDARDAYKEVKDSMNVYDKNFFGEFNGFEVGLFSKLVNNAVSQIEKYPKGSADRKKVAYYYIKEYEKRLNEARKQVDEYNNELVAAREELRNGQNMIQKILSTLL